MISPSAEDSLSESVLNRRDPAPKTTPADPTTDATPGEGATATSRRPHRWRNGRRRGRPTATGAQAPEEQAADSSPEPVTVSPAEPPKADAGQRPGPSAEPLPTRTRREWHAKGPDETQKTPFMHPSEQEFAKILDFYHVPYLYEPRSFPLRWQGERVVEMFTPDFYLPVQDQYIELTTMKQNLVTQKNRKLRHLRELYPDVNVLLLYRRDIMRLLAKYDYGPLAEAEVKGIERILFRAEEVQRRVHELGGQITADYAGQEVVLIGVLRGVVCFIADLMRQVNLPLRMDFMEIAGYGSDEASEVAVTKDAAVPVEGQHVILVEDIVDTGMTLQFLLRHLWAKRPASVAVCTLLDKQVRRMNEVPIRYRGFEIPDEFVVGYGLDYNGLYRNLPDICVLKPTEPQVKAQR